MRGNGGSWGRFRHNSKEEKCHVKSTSPHDTSLHHLTVVVTNPPPPLSISRPRVGVYKNASLPSGGVGRYESSSVQYYTIRGGFLFNPPLPPPNAGRPAVNSWPKSLNNGGRYDTFARLMNAVTKPLGESIGKPIQPTEAQPQTLSFSPSCVPWRPRRCRWSNYLISSEQICRLACPPPPPSPKEKM